MAAAGRAATAKVAVGNGAATGKAAGADGCGIATGKPVGADIGTDGIGIIGCGDGIAIGIGAGPGMAGPAGIGERIGGGGPGIVMGPGMPLPG